MFFLHCADCASTERVIAHAVGDTSELAAEPVVRAFHAAHAGCRTSVLRPTGRDEASLPWHDPLAERRIEVRGEDGTALAIGTRSDVAEPLAWRLESTAVDEEVVVELDRRTFFRVVDRALHPHHVPTRTIAAWASQIDDFVRRVPLEEVVVLHDDPARPNASHACLLLTSRVALEATLARHALDEDSRRRLLATFEDPEFPPLVVSRRLVAQRSAA